MGYGTWSAETYSRVTRAKIDSGTDFAYTSHARMTGSYKQHPLLDVKNDDGTAKLYESRDSDEHPNSTPIVVGFDETGSMGENPHLLQRSLKELFGMLIRHDYASDPQIAIASYGDAWCDRAPIGCSQFESDNRIDECLDNVLIEGRGGGNDGETSTLLAYFIAHHTVTDSWEKRHKKGYVFLIGDEAPLSVTSSHIRKNIGDAVQGDVTPSDAFGALKEKWNVYFLLIDNYAARDQRSRAKYTELLGDEHVITIADGSEAPAVIAGIIGACEQTADSDTLSDDLVAAGFSNETALAAVNAIKGLYKTGGKSGDGGDIDVYAGVGDLHL